MPLIEEIPGALERPSGCRVEIWQSDNGQETTLVIPPRETPLWLVVAIAVVVVNLILLLVSGAALLFGHRSILFMADISPGGLPFQMRRFAVPLAFGWGVLMASIFAVLVIMLRPLLLRELLTIDPRGITREIRILGRRIRSKIEIENLRGFRLNRDPQHLEPSILTVQGRGEAWTIAENVREADREWLASVGAALLRRL